MKNPKKNYSFLQTASAVAAVVSKVRLMQQLTLKEELIYFIQVKGLTEEVAKKLIKNKPKIIKTI